MNLLGTLRGEHNRPIGVRGQWDLVTAVERNIFQHVASATGGFVTPANAVTVAGFVDGYFGGLFDYINGDKTSAAARMTRSFLTDLADGWLAEATQTAGEVGAVMDAGADKLRIVGTEVALYKDPIPPVKSISMIAMQGVILVSSILIDKYGGAPDPTALSKLAMAMTAGTKLTYMYEEASLESGHNQAKTLFGNTRKVTEPISFALTGFAAVKYARQAIQLRQMAKRQSANYRM